MVAGTRVRRARRRFSEEFKAEAVRLVLEGDRTIGVLLGSWT
jgi:transposase-like protein